MIEYRSGDMFTSDAKALAHGVNTQGKMGAGVAMVMKQRYPEMYDHYVVWCANSWLPPGGIWPWLDVSSGIMIFNLATQIQPGANAQLAFITDSFRGMYQSLNRFKIDKVAIPKIGCGIGGLAWENVEPLVLLSNEVNAPNVTTEVWTL